MEDKNDIFCKQLPKIELHAHLNGSLTPRTLKQIGCSDAIILEYEKSINFLKITNRLEDCFPLFKIPHNATRNQESVYQATKYVIQDFYNDNIIYLELRTTPREEKCMTRVQYIEAVIKAIEECEEKIITKLILSIDRNCNFETAKETMELIIMMKQKYPNIIKGVDFSGNPMVGVFDKNLFKDAVDHGLCTTLHCAERSNGDETKEIINFGPNRIGHGTCIHPSYGGSQEAWKLYSTRSIPLECCLSSNVVCGTARSYKEHHLQEWIKTSLPFTLCTDDPGIFATSLSQELMLAMRYFNLTPEDLWKISYNSVAFSFASDIEKDILRNKLQTWKLKNSF